MMKYTLYFIEIEYHKSVQIKDKINYKYSSDICLVLSFIMKKKSSFSFILFDNYISTKQSICNDDYLIFNRFYILISRNHNVSSFF